MNDTEKRELDAWIAEHVFGWIASGYTGTYDPPLKDKATGKSAGIPLMFNPTTDPAAALEVLKMAAAKFPKGIVGIGSPMGKESVASTLPKTSQGWVVGWIGKPCNFDVEADTLELAICLFTKKLFTAEAA